MRILLLLVTFACSHGSPTCTDPATEAQGVAWDRLSGRIAYSRWENPLSPRAGRGCIYLLEVSTRHIELLWNVALGEIDIPYGWARDLAFRKNGSTLSFAVQNPAGYWELHDFSFSSRADSILFPMTSTHHLHPSWSYDGRLAYYSSGGTGTYEMIDGNALIAGAIRDRVAWTRSGTFVASWSSTASGADLDLVDPASQSATALIRSTAGEIYDQPAVSADGQMLAFVRRGTNSQGRYDEELWIANADGTGPRQLTGDQDDEQPAWSSNGRAVLFNRYGQGLFLYELDAGTISQVTRRTADYMDWQP
jgi:Tol biopolymer transport system component